MNNSIKYALFGYSVVTLFGASFSWLMLLILLCFGNRNSIFYSINLLVWVFYSLSLDGNVGSVQGIEVLRYVILIYVLLRDITRPVILITILSVLSLLLHTVSFSLWPMMSFLKGASSILLIIGFLSVFRKGRNEVDPSSFIEYFATLTICGLIISKLIGQDSFFADVQMAGIVYSYFSMFFLLFARQNKWSYLYAMIFAVHAVWTDARGPVISALIVGILSSYAVNRKIFYTLVAVGIIGILGQMNFDEFLLKGKVYENSSVAEVYLEERGEKFLLSIDNFRQNPIFGIGWGIPSDFNAGERIVNFGEFSYSYEKSVLTTALLEEIGIVGLGIFLFIAVKTIFRKGHNNALKYFTVSFTLILSHSEFGLFSAGPLGFFLWLINMPLLVTSGKR